ncbi:hypothetical protein AY606_05990 [Acinetobacter sp. SFB]|uniref:phage tail tube protein n=1 Tax=Acinetobacter sp. SFB TaxID=1805634 RepID=UPI0007D7E0F1|nr:phage tail tube protein [Acinetobacter sp. SFB]OAL78976.1 hypothetical protein AY606_05990 [Acinetobacter sp. SFB]
MARRTQGSMLWFVAKTAADPAVYELVKVGCPLNFKPGTDSKDKIEDTCLEEEEYKTYMEGGGLSDTGSATFDINADPAIESHGRLYDMVGGEGVTWIKGWAGKTKGSVKAIVPTVDAATGEVTLPPTRSWSKFKGYVESFPMDSEANSVVKTTVTIQRQTKVEWIRETAP